MGVTTNRGAVESATGAFLKNASLKPLKSSAVIELPGVGGGAITGILGCALLGDPLLDLLEDALLTEIALAWRRSLDIFVNQALEYVDSTFVFKNTETVASAGRLALLVIFLSFSYKNVLASLSPLSHLRSRTVHSVQREGCFKIFV